MENKTTSLANRDAIAGSAASGGYPADMVCRVCGHAEMTCTRRNPGVIEYLNKLCGIGEEWICLRCGHIWNKAG